MKSELIDRQALRVTIPFVDLHAQYVSIKQEIDEAIADVIKRSAFIRGSHVEQFEASFAKTMQRRYCVSCANGTDSLYIAMYALGVKPGDEIIAPAHSWISTTSTITRAGAKVVFCDTNADTFTIDPQQIEAKISSRTVGIIPVHLYGQAADMDAIMEISRKHKLWVLEDCAQAHLARYKGKLVGTFGDAASFSFYPGKNLGAMGDAGALVTDDKLLADKMAMFARHGGLTKGDHQIEGINSRMDGLQAAVLSVKLKYLEQWKRQRQQLAQSYSEKLGGVLSVATPRVADHCEHVWHLYVIRHERRDELKERLRANGVETNINYPVALPFLPAYSRYQHKPNEFPSSFRNQSRVLSLPIYAEMPSEYVDRVVSVVVSFE